MTSPPTQRPTVTHLYPIGLGPLSRAIPLTYPASSQTATSSSIPDPSVPRQTFGLRVYANSAGPDRPTERTTGYPPRNATRSYQEIVKSGPYPWAASTVAAILSPAIGDSKRGRAG